MRGTFKGIHNKGSLKGSIRVLFSGLGSVAAPYFGVLIIRILLFRVLY